MKYFVVLLASALSLVTSLYGQDDLFPDVKGYSKVNDYPVYTPDDLWNIIDGAADAYLALGFRELHITEYVKGKTTVKAEIYSFGDDATAFGIYSLERSPGYSFIPVGVQGYAEEGVLNFYKGTCYVKIMSHSASSKTASVMKELAYSIADRIKGKNEFPELLKLFPPDGLQKNEETYILGDVLGHEFLRGAFRANYEVEGDRFEIYLFKCANADDAGKMTASLAGDAYSPGDDTFKYIFDDGFNGVLHIARQNEILVIISGLGRDKTDLADNYIDKMVK